MDNHRANIRWMTGIASAAGLAFAIGAFTSGPANSQAGAGNECPLNTQFCGNGDNEESSAGEPVANGIPNGIPNGVPNGLENGSDNGISPPT